MNIFDLPGPQFVLLYVTLLVVGIAVALALRDRLRGPEADAGVDVRTFGLQPVEVALLAEGERHAVRTAVAGLAHRQLLVVEGKLRTVRATGRPPADSARTEQRIHTMMGDAAKSIDQVAALAGSLFEPVRGRLESLGLLVADEQRWKLRAVPAAVLAAVLLVGLYKINVGMSRNRPITYLALLCWVTVGAMVVMLVRTPRRSRRGDYALDSLRSRNTGLRQTVAARPDRVAPDDFTLAIALFGVAIIQTGPLTELRTVFARPQTGGDSTTSGSSCSSSGGGGCGGGCGGGGCGGCGS